MLGLRVLAPAGFAFALGGCAVIAGYGDPVVETLIQAPACQLAAKP